VLSHRVRELHDPVSGRTARNRLSPAENRRCPSRYRPAWQEWRDSNPQPPVLETGALAIELHSSGSGCGGPYNGPPRGCHALYMAPLQGRSSAKRAILERVKGIEPSSSAWKAVALPLSYTRV